MDKQREQATKIAHQLIVYQESECADQKERVFDTCRTFLKS